MREAAAAASLIGFLCTAFVAVGLSFASIGPALPEFAAVAAIDVSSIGVVYSMLFAGYLLSQVTAEGWRPRPPRVLAALRASYRSRLTVSLMTFFLMPVLAFGLWSFARLTDDARRAGDLLVQSNAPGGEQLLIQGLTHKGVADAEAHTAPGTAVLQHRHPHCVFQCCEHHTLGQVGHGQ